MIDYKQAILDLLIAEFPKHKLEWSPIFTEYDFCPRFALIVNGKDSTLRFNPELVQDMYVCIEGHKLGLDALDIRNLMIPFTIEKLKPIFKELSIVYSNALRDYLNS